MNSSTNFSDNISADNPNFGLVPITEEEYTLFGFETSNSSFISPLSQDLVLTDEYLVFDDDGDIISNSLYFGDLEADKDVFSEKSFAPEDDGNLNIIPALDDLELVGGFGDYDGGNDTTLEVKDGETVIETFSMTGDGFATLYRDDESKYIFFSDTDENTRVDINAISNIEFEDFNGEALSIVTRGSIEAENITLVDDEDPDKNSGLSLRAGIGGTNLNNAIFDSYSIVNFGDSEMVDLNYYGNVVGNFIDNSGQQRIFFYDGQNIYDFPNYHSTQAFGINDYGDIVGEGIASASDPAPIPFIASANGSFEEIQLAAGNGRVLPEGNSNIYPLSDNNEDFPYENAPVEYEYESNVRDISNLFEVVANLKHIPPTSEFPYYEDPSLLGVTEAVNIGLDYLSGGNSRGFGINDLSQVVGVNKTNNRGFIFDNTDKSVSVLPTLSGSDYSAAYAINNEEQVVGSSGGRAFFYESGVMQDMGVFYTGDPTKRLGIDINNLGQAVVTSTEGVPYLYENEVLSDINDLLNSQYDNLDLEITEARGINDRGQIIVQANFNDNELGFLLNPNVIPHDTVTVGNISTFGESVILEGDKVYLNGEAIATEGGLVYLDGDTVVNDNLTINSSITDVEEGDIAGQSIVFTGSVDSQSEGEQSLVLKAGAGDVEFRKAVGETSPLFDLTVASAGSMTATEDLTIDNELNLEVIDAITTANITSGGLASIKTGQIGEELFGSTGNVTAGNIDALSLEVSSNGNFTAEDIATGDGDGDIKIISLNEIAANSLTAINGGIELTSGNAGIQISGEINGDLGLIATSLLDITTSKIISSQDVILLRSSQGAITVNGSALAYEEVSFASANDVAVKAVTSQNAGVDLVSATGTIGYSGTISSAGNINVASAQDLVINRRLYTKNGSMSFVSTEGSVKVLTFLNSGSNIDITAKRNIKTSGLLSNGDIIVEAENGRFSDNSRYNSQGGDISISGQKRVKTGNIISSGGDVSLSSHGNYLVTGYIRADRGAGEGNVNLTALRSVKVLGKVKVNNAQYSILAGEGGTTNIVHQQLSRGTRSSNFKIGGSVRRSGALANIAKEGAPVNISTKPIPPSPGGSGAGGGLLLAKISVWALVFRYVLDAGETAPRHQSEINPISGQPYSGEAEFELVNALTEEQDNEITRLTRIPSIGLEWKYVYDEGKFGTATDEEGDRCLEIPLPYHLGTNYGNHHDYADYVFGTKDIILIPPKPIGSESSAIYDGRVQAGFAATVPSALPSQSFSAIGFEPINALGEVKTGHKFLLRIINGNPLPAIPADPKNGKKRIPSDLERFEDLIDEVRGEILVAKACGEQYFLSFDLLGVARAGASLVNSRLATEGISNIRVRHIESPFS